MTFTTKRLHLSAPVVFGLLACSFLCAVAQEVSAPSMPRTPQELLSAMIANEKEAGARHDHSEYLSNERSDRTGGHLWTERVVDTSVGKVRMLLAEDGQPLSPERAKAEHDRLEDIAEHPDDFARRELSQKNDEQHDRDMLDQLPSGFLLENIRLENGVWKMDYRPNPAVSPSGIEERVLHGMSGWLAINARDLRLVHIEGHLPADVTIGYGLIANIKAGSSFLSDRQFVDGRWHTIHLVTDILGKAALFKTVAKSSSFTRSEFKLLDPNVTPTQAVRILLQ